MVLSGGVHSGCLVQPPEPIGDVQLPVPVLVVHGRLMETLATKVVSGLLMPKLQHLY